MQAVKAVDAGFQRFGHHLSAAVGIEAIDHHPVEPRQHAQLPRTFAQDRANLFGRAQPSDHAAHHRGYLDLVALGRFAFEDDRAPRSVDGHIEQAVVVQQMDREHPLHRILAPQIGDAVAQQPYGAGLEDFRGRHADQPARRRSEIGLGIGGALDHPLGAQRQQEAERLDRAGDVDRLAVAIGEVDGVGESGCARPTVMQIQLRSSATAIAARLKNWNVSMAASQASSSHISFFSKAAASNAAQKFCQSALMLSAGER